MDKPEIVVCKYWIDKEHGTVNVLEIMRGTLPMRDEAQGIAVMDAQTFAMYIEQARKAKN